MKNTISIFVLLFLIEGISCSSWVEQYVNPSPPKLNCVSCDMGAAHGWIGGDNGTVLFTSSSGQNWSYRNSSLFANNNVNVIAYVYYNIALCSVTSSTTTYIYRTADTGYTWSAVYQQPGGRIRDIKMSDALTGYAYGDPVNGRWTLLKTTNAGLTFDSSGMYLPQSGSETGFYNAMSVRYQTGYIYLGTNYSRIYKSINGGLSWSIIPTAFQNVKTISFGDNSFVYGFAGGSGAAISTNQGASWQSLILPGTGDCNAFTNDGPTYIMRAAFYCKTSQIYLSTDGGANFIINYNSPIGGNYTHIYINSIDIDVFFRHGWAVRDNGGISRYDSLVSSGIKKIGEDIPQKFSLSQNYPNPFNPTTKINYQLPIADFVKLSVYDILGNEVAVLVNEKQSPGTYQVEWPAYRTESGRDGTNYSSGIYFYKIIAGDYSETRKMVLLK